MQQFKSFGDSFLDHARDVALYPLDPNNRVYVLYVLTSVLIAFAIYIVKTPPATRGGW